MKKFKNILCCFMCAMLSFMLCSCKETPAEESTSTTQAVGYLVYQHATTSNRYETIKTNPNKITEIITITNDTVTADNFVFYLYSADAFASGTENIKTNTTIKDEQITQTTLSVRFELALETTEALLFIIYKNPDGTIFYEYDREITNISFSPIQETINLDENTHVNKIEVSFEKNLSIQEEYQG